MSVDQVDAVGDAAEITTSLLSVAFARVDVCCSVRPGQDDACVLQGGDPTQTATLSSTTDDSCCPLDQENDAGGDDSCGNV